MAPPSAQTPAVRAWRTLLNAQNTALRAISHDLAQAEALPLEWYDVLLELFRAPGHRLRLGELGDRVVLTRSGISRLISRLADAGLVVRTEVGDDARGVAAKLTAAGERAFRATWPRYADGIATHFGRYFTDAECETLESLLARVSVA